jgi:multiple antibiotic resistance protein
MNEAWAYGLMCFTSFFTIINPFGTMPIFLSMTANLDSKEKTQTATRAALVSLFTLILFAFSGRLLFDFFGISVHSFRIVGGILFFMVGWDMLQARLQRTKVSQKDIHAYVGDISVTPLAIPMITGPGAITTAIVLMESADSLPKQISLFASMTLVIFLVWAILVSGSKVSKFLGETGSKILLRLMGLIVMVIAVEFFLSGLKPVIVQIIDYVQKP